MRPDTTNSRLLHVFIFAGLLFACLAGYLTWFELQGKTGIMQSAYNRRLQAEEQKVLRGSFYDHTGVCLAKTESDGITSTRLYPYGSLYAHIIGYNSVNYGKTLLEAQYNNWLQGREGIEIVNKLGSMLSGGRRTGFDVKLTIDHALQQNARELMGKKNGALVALDPKTGAVLAMVSTPDYDPNSDALDKAWPGLVEDEDSPLLPRAVMGLYPPGSTFKVVTAAAALESGLGNTTVTDEGKTVIDGMTVRNYNSKAFGEIDMRKAFAVSSNVYFAQLAELIGPDSLIAKAKATGFEEKIPFDIPVVASRIGDHSMGKTELAATGFGQGKLMATPLQMALISAAIANDGVIMKPYLADTITDAGGKTYHRTKPQALYQMTDGSTAAIVNSMMQDVVKNGTGTNARLKSYTVAGKTGTAQNEKSGKGARYDHSWFIGFAPAEDPQIAVAIILEYDGKGGGKTSATIAGKVMEQWLDGNEQ